MQTAMGFQAPVSPALVKGEPMLTPVDRSAEVKYFPFLVLIFRVPLAQ